MRTDPGATTMPLTLSAEPAHDWQVRHIGVVGPGIVGMPMAALLASARIRIGTAEPAVVTVVQRASSTSGWKVAAINQGRSPIGGVEPALDAHVRDAVAAGLLRASHDYGVLADADIVLIAVQTDRRGDGPDYGPLMEAIAGVAGALRRRPPGNLPLVVFESTLAPSSMATVVRDAFARAGLEEGRDLLLGNSPNRVMPGRLVDRVASSDKLVAGLHPATPGLVRRLYAHIVTRGTLHPTNSLTAEVVKVLENAYRDVRIAYAAEVARDCDARGLDFFAVRDAANNRLAQADAASGSPTAVPTGGLLVPTAGVGGHCLPKDGVLLWWRAAEAGLDRSRSLILEARRINDESPAHVIEIAERAFGPIAGRSVALLGVAYRFDSEDTRNSPTLQLARLLADRGCGVTLHDPHVAEHDQNLARSGFADRFTRSLPQAVAEAELLIFCVGHAAYCADLPGIARLAPHARGVVDAANLMPRGATHCGGLRVAGIGRGSRTAPPEYVAAVVEGFRAVELGVANEVEMLAEFLNDLYAGDEFNRISVNEVRRLAATCPTGCALVEPEAAKGDGVTRFPSRLVARALVPDEARARE